MRIVYHHVDGLSMRVRDPLAYDREGCRKLTPAGGRIATGFAVGEPLAMT